MDESLEQRMRTSKTDALTTEEFSNPHITTRNRRTKKNRISGRKLLFISLSILILLLAIGVPVGYYTWDHHTIVEGVKISGINVSNMSQLQAKAAVNKDIESLLNQTVKLTDGQHDQDVKLEDLGLTLSADKALKDAYGVSRIGSLYQRINSKREAAKGLDFKLTSQWDDKKMQTCLDQLFGQYNKPAVDASFQITDQNVMVISKEQAGFAYDSETLKTQIKAINYSDPVKELKVNYQEQKPKVLASQLEAQKITGLLASYTTHFDPSQTARTENVQLAAKALDKAVIKPDDILSFNNIVGERTVAGGYKDAYIIVDGKFVPGLAGGICQVSSTLYNTGLLANLAVAQRSNHDLAITYAPLGQDATVAYPDLDLKFRNNTGGYLLIRTSSTSNSLTIDLYGKVNPGQEVNITDTTESVIQPEEQHVVDKTLKHGESVVKQLGQPGYIVKSVRTVKVNGNVVSSEPLQQSVYKALPKIVDVGP
ncbi:putative vancomycin resistance protein [Desulfosporosinus acidiphilus SJ4]|uniref:Putative vancomycin resistance protein n=1 Tax=Desulfosporosinus acidiphilus (strain DSM 22704 / JCM 16185 / SJ4) TaxID=646529 RepID=I4DCM1_DESAJ|nr:VanW family protein [Desulfosporosinus acidiphilus]AFM43545.1 putative vancomycin resistance protein [Desulfosporosinus acidiphilus SJ4]